MHGQCFTTDFLCGRLQACLSLVEVIFFIHLKIVLESDLHFCLVCPEDICLPYPRPNAEQIAFQNTATISESEAYQYPLFLKASKDPSEQIMFPF